MTIYTDEDARRQLQAILDAARSEGEVRIRTKDGQEYALRPVTSASSPFEIKGVDLRLSAGEIVGFVREGRER